MSRATSRFVLAVAAPLLFWHCARFEQVQVRHVRLVGPRQGASVAVEFDLNWRNSFRDSVNWDAAWVVVKFSVGEGPWRHATLSSLPQHTSVGNDNGIAPTVEPATDGLGAFVYRATAGEGAVNWDDVRVRWNYAADGVADDDEVQVRVVALDMVYIPPGAFVLGDGEGGDVRGHFRSTGGALPFAVTGESPLVLGGRAEGGLGSNNGYGMNEPFPDDFEESIPAALPAQFPKGFAGFYVMRNELTQGHYATFLNTLTPRQQRRRNPADHDPAVRPGRERNSIVTTPPFWASSPDRAANVLSWMDAAAFADWAALRPMSELEFEKAARGGAGPVTGEFAWGSNAIHQRRYSLAQINTRHERITNAGSGTGNAAYALTTGGAEPCWSCIRGPLDVAAFWTPTATRAEAGASYYRVRGLSGNLAERVATVGNPLGRRFDGRHGDGNLNEDGNASGPEVSRWPGSSNTGSRSQVIGAVGSGFRGGSWASAAANLRTSDREYAATPDNSRHPTFGYRFVRTAPR